MSRIDHSKSPSPPFPAAFGRGVSLRPHRVPTIASGCAPATLYPAHGFTRSCVNTQQFPDFMLPQDIGVTTKWSSCPRITDFGYPTSAGSTKTTTTSSPTAAIRLLKKHFQHLVIPPCWPCGGAQPSAIGAHDLDTLFSTPARDILSRLRAACRILPQPVLGPRYLPVRRRSSPLQARTTAANRCRHEPAHRARTKQLADRPATGNAPRELHLLQLQRKPESDFSAPRSPARSADAVS